jgi:benzil reductase ((S)-benzoin forming)
MDYYFITGSSRGLGEALARNLLEPENTLFCFSRSPNQELSRRARQRGCSLHYLRADLTDFGKLEPLLGECFRQIRSPASITLFNNAGVLDPIGPIETVDAADIESNIRINLTAVMVMSSLFLRLADNYECAKRIVNISSGAGRHPYDGWGPYCAAKAGVDMFSRCLSEEQEVRDRPVQVLSIAPGVLDTQMQRRIREVDPSRFRRKEKFLRLKQEGGLDSPDQAARKLLRILRDGELPGGPLADLRDFD